MPAERRREGEEQEAKVYDLSHRVTVMAANEIRRSTVGFAHAIMARTGLDPAASTRSKVALASGGIVSSNAGKVVHTVHRTPLVPVGVFFRSRTGDSGTEYLRLVKESEEYHIKRPFVPSLLGGLAFEKSDFNVFYVENFIGPEGSDSAEQLPIDSARVSSGNIGLEASAENIIHGMDEDTRLVQDLVAMSKSLRSGVTPLTVGL